MFITFVLSLMLLLGVILAALPKSRAVRITIIIFVMIIISLEVVSIYFGGGGFVDYQFYVNIDLDNILMAISFFKYEALFVSSLAVIVCFILYLIAKWLHRVICCRYLLILSLLFVTGLSYQHGPINSLYDVYTITHSTDKNLKHALQQIGIDPSKYTFKPDIIASKGKNIIVLSLESLEQNFMSPQFEQLTPNLVQLSKDNTFYNRMKVGAGSSWTMASLYTYMTGFPLFYGSTESNPFKKAKETHLPNLGYILKKAGYQTRYVLGLPDFAGMGDTARLFDIPVVSEKTYPGRYIEAPFGLYDRDVFDLAEHELDNLLTAQKPFALFLSTISTHAPHGFPDKRMEEFIPAREDGLEFAVASLDYNLGKFMVHLKEKGILEDTIFYIFPDHTLMGAGTNVIKKLSATERNLYVITNASSEQLGTSPMQEIYQIDLPRLILDGAGVKNNATFLTDFIHDQDKHQFIRQHKNQIAAINYASLIESNNSSKE